MRITYFQSQVFYFLFMFLKSTAFEFFAKIMRGNYVYWCSIHISFNPTSHLNWYLTNTYRYPTGTLRRIHVDLTWILRRYVEDQISTNFYVISTYFFDVISLVKKSTSFPRTFFDVISMVENLRCIHVLFSI